MRFVEPRPVALRVLVFVVAWCWWCSLATPVLMAAQTNEDPPPTNDPVRAAKAGLHVFHNRVTTFVDAQLDVLEENGLHNGEEIAIVFLGITLRWEDAWQLTWDNFQRGERVLVVPTYNLPEKWMDFPGAAFDKLKVESPPSLLKTRKIGVPELLDHLGERDIHVFGLAFSSGANFVLQENAARLAQYARNSSSDSNPPNVPSLILYHSGQISEKTHRIPLQEAGFQVRPSGERAIVTALQENFPDMDLTGQGITAWGISRYFGNAARHLPQPKGPEGRHGYIEFREEVNQQLVNASVLNAAKYNLLITGLTAPKPLEMPETIAMILGDMKGQYLRGAEIVQALEKAKTQLEQQKQSDQVVARALANWDAPRLIQQVLDIIRAEQVRVSTPPGERRLIGFRLPWDEDLFCRVLKATSDDLRVVYESNTWIEKQLGYTRWHTVARKGSDEAFLLYDATGQRDDEAVEAVKMTLDQIQIEKHGKKRGVVLVGNPLSREYRRLKAKIETDENLEVVAEVDTRNKSGEEIHEEMDETLRRTEVTAAIGIHGEERVKENSDEIDDDYPDDEDYPEDEDEEIEKIEGGWRILFKINGVPAWEVVLDEDGNIIWEGPPGKYPGGYDDNGKPIIPKHESRNLATQRQEPIPILSFPHRVPELDRLATLGLRFSSAFSVNPLCSPMRATVLASRLKGAMGEVARRSASPDCGFSRPSRKDFFASSSPVPGCANVFRVPLTARHATAVSGRSWSEARLTDARIAMRIAHANGNGLFGDFACQSMGRGEGLSLASYEHGLPIARFTPTHPNVGAVPDPVRPAMAMYSRPRPPFGLMDHSMTMTLTGAMPCRIWLTGMLQADAEVQPRDRQQASELAKSGEAWLQKDEFDKAIIDLTKAIEIDPRNVFAYNNRGLAWYAKGNFASFFATSEYDKAIENFSEAIELEPAYSEAYYNRGLVRHKKGEYDLAIADYDKAIGLNSKFAAAHWSRGDTRRAIGENDRALADYNKAVDIAPKFLERYCEHAEQWHKEHEYDLAIAACDKVIELEPKHANAHLCRGRSWHDQAEWDKAIYDYTKAIEINPEFAWAFANRGEVYRQKGEYDQAITDLTKAIEINPKNYWALARRGAAYCQKGNCDKGVTDFTKAIEVNPKYDWALANRGEAYLLKGEYDQAITDFTKAIEINPTYDWALANRGEAYRLKREYDQAIADLTKAIEINPKYYGALAKRGAAYLMKREYDQAITDLTKAIEINPKYDWALANRGEAYRLKREYDQAITDLTKAIEINPKYGWAYTQLAWVWIDQNDSDKAIAVGEKFVATAPDDPESYRVRSFILHEFDRNDDALADAERAIQMVPNSPDGYTSRANALHGKGAYSEAVRGYTKAIELAPTDCKASISLPEAATIRRTVAGRC